MVSKSKSGYVYLTVKPETKEALYKLKIYGDTYDDVISRLLRRDKQ